MNKIKMIVLDILKPHKPTILEYAKEIVKANKDYSVNLRVIELDEKTETIELVVEGANVNYEEIEQIISALGGTVHSIDEVAVGLCAVRSRRPVK